MKLLIKRHVWLEGRQSSERHESKDQNVTAGASVFRWKFHLHHQDTRRHDGSRSYKMLLDFFFLLLISSFEWMVCFVLCFCVHAHVLQWEQSVLRWEPFHGLHIQGINWTKWEAVCEAVSVRTAGLRSGSANITTEGGIDVFHLLLLRKKHSQMDLVSDQFSDYKWKWDPLKSASFFFLLELKSYVELWGIFPIVLLRTFAHLDCWLTKSCSWSPQAWESCNFLAEFPSMDRESDLYPIYRAHFGYWAAHQP